MVETALHLKVLGPDLIWFEIYRLYINDGSKGQRLCILDRAVGAATVTCRSGARACGTSSEPGPGWSSACTSAGEPPAEPPGRSCACGAVAKESESERRNGLNRATPWAAPAALAQPCRCAAARAGGRWAAAARRTSFRSWRMRRTPSRCPRMRRSSCCARRSATGSCRSGSSLRT